MAAITATLFVPSICCGTPQADPIKVGVLRTPAFLEPSKAAPGAYTGFSGDLWNAVTAKLGRTSEFVEFHDFPTLIEATADGKIDVAVTDMLITAERARKLDFSYPITDGGLRVAVHAEPAYSFGQVWQLLVERGHIKVLATGALIVMTMSVVLVGFWRRFDKEFPTARHDAFAESLLRTVSLTVTGKTKVTDNPKHAISKIGAAAWLAFGAGVVAYVTATFTSAMTAEATKREVNAASDLGGKPVGALKGTVGERYCQTHGLDVRSYENTEAVVQALLTGRVVAVVGDGPMLEAYDRAHPELPLTVVGALFDKHKFAFGMRRGSTLRHDIDMALLELQEAGETDAIYARYFSGA